MLEMLVMPILDLVRLGCRVHLILCICCPTMSATPSSSDMTPTVSLEVDLRISIYQLEAVYGWVTDQIRPAHLLLNQAPPCLGSS